MSGDCNATVDGAERRIQERFDVHIPVNVQGCGGRFDCTTENLSTGGLCLSDAENANLSVGDKVELDVNVPGNVEPVHVEAEVRWVGGPKRSKVGLMFRGGKVATIAACLTTFLAGAANASASSSPASVPSFDPKADVVLDMNAGGERPDEFQLLQAFEQQYSAFDQCVANAKKDPADQLPGEVDVEVLLNPNGSVPLGVNTALPNEVAKNKGLSKCLRTAIAAAGYPKYDGVPVVVSFNFELDPGSDYIEEGEEY